MLTEMDGIEGRKGVYIMAATNRQEIIDPAITRPGRLETILYVGLPVKTDRVAILNALTKKKTRPDFAPNVSFEILAEKCEGYSGADLRALVTKASELAFSESIVKTSTCHMVNMNHFEQAMTSMRQSVQGKEAKRYEKMRQKLNHESPDTVQDDRGEAEKISENVIDAVVEASVNEMVQEELVNDKPVKVNEPIVPDSPEYVPAASPDFMPETPITEENTVEKSNGVSEKSDENTEKSNGKSEKSNENEEKSNEKSDKKSEKSTTNDKPVKIIDDNDENMELDYEYEPPEPPKKYQCQRCWTK